MFSLILALFAATFAGADDRYVTAYDDGSVRDTVTLERCYTGPACDTLVTFDTDAEDGLWRITVTEVHP